MTRQSTHGKSETSTTKSGVSFPFQEFFHQEASSGILLLLAALVALAWANSPWGQTYTDFWNTKLTVGHLKASLGHWVNDGLMAIFFFVVGLEIKREVLVGELASARRAALPVAAAVGGAIVPAVIYFTLNRGTPEVRGWGVPMATDIAFSLGVLALLGTRAPAGLKIFLTALAIVDDLIAVLVIAIFYNSNVNWSALALAAAVLGGLIAINRIGVRSTLPYAVLGIALWALTLESGVHATIAGVLLAMTIPAATKIDPATFLAEGHRLLNAFAEAGDLDDDIRRNADRQAAIQELEAACADVEAPLQRLEHLLHPWVAFVIMPVFALANAGVRIEGDLGAALGNRVTLGVLLGLVLGKQIGIMLATVVATRLRVADLPTGVGWLHLSGAAWLAGIGFTMSLFIADLAFDEGAAITAAKIGILLASLIAGAIGATVLMRAGPGEAPSH